MNIKLFITCMMFINIVLSIVGFGGESYYTIRLDDPRAIYLTKDDFSVHADGIGDDTEGL